MRSVLRKRTVMLGVVLVLVATSLVGGYVLAGSAPATTRQQAPIWLGTLETTTTGRTLLVGGGIDVKTDLSSATVKVYKREAGQNANTYVGKATMSYSTLTGNQFYVRVPRLKRSTIITAVWGGNSNYFGSRTWAFAGVKPRLTLTATMATQERTRLRIDIDPVQPSHARGALPETLASIECLINGVWTYFPGELGSESTNGQSWCVYNYGSVPAGTYTIRANFKGTNYNAPAVSKSVQVTVP